MALTNVWIASFFGPPPAAIGATPVWIAPNDGTVPSAVQSVIAGYFTAVAGASPVWIAGFFAPPPAAIGATPICISGWSGSGGGGGATTSVWSASDAAANAMTLSNGGLTVAFTASGWQSIRSSISQASGKFYVEFLSNVTVGQETGLGIASAGFVPTSYLGSSNYSAGSYNGGSGNLSSPAANFTFNYSISGGVSNANDVWAIAIDLTAGKYWIARNNVWLGSGNPGAGTNAIASFVAPALGQAYFPAIVAQGATSGPWTLQPTDASLKYRPPPGFQAWDGGPVTPPASSVWSASDAAANAMTLSNGGLTVAGFSSGGWVSVRSTVGKTTGKLYVEFLVNALGDANKYIMLGLASAGFNPAGFVGSSNYSCGMQVTDGEVHVSAGFTENYTVAQVPNVNDVFALAVDFNAGKVWIAQNNVWSNSSSPATGSLPVVSFTPATVGALFAGISTYLGSNTLTLQPTAASQKYLPPPGFQAWDGGPVTPSTSVWSASDAAANGMTLSNGGLTVTATTSVWQSIRGTVSQTSGKRYIEFLCAVTETVPNNGFGIASSSFVATNYLSTSNYSSGAYLGSGSALGSSGFTVNAGFSIVGAVVNDIIQIAVDLTTGSLWLGVNNVWEASGNPATGASPLISIVAPALGLVFYPAISLNSPAAGAWTLQPTAASQKYAPPSGFSPWG